MGLKKRAKSRDVRTTEVMIVKSLMQGEKTAYSLSNIEKIASKVTVLKALSNLMNRQIIERRKAGVRGRQPYRLNWESLVLALSIVQTYPMLEAAVQTYSDLLPLIFGKWKAFREAGVLKIVINRLYGNIGMYSSSAQELLGLKQVDLAKIEKPSSPFEVTADVLCPFTTMLYPLDGSDPKKLEEFEALKPVIQSDPELLEFIETYLDGWERRYEEVVKYVRIWREWWGLTKDD